MTVQYQIKHGATGVQRGSAAHTYSGETSMWLRQNEDCSHHPRCAHWAFPYFVDQCDTCPFKIDDED
jgi:hypothetical protein